jgi:hypothetical protein
MDRRTFKIVWAIFIAYIVGSVVYEIATGRDLFSDNHYNTAGRIVSGVILVAASVFFFYMWRDTRRIERQHAMRRTNDLLSGSSIPHRCPVMDGEAQCIEPEGHGGPHDFRFDYDDPEDV